MLALWWREDSEGGAATAEGGEGGVLGFQWSPTCNSIWKRREFYIYRSYSSEFLQEGERAQRNESVWLPCVYSLFYFWLDRGVSQEEGQLSKSYQLIKCCKFSADYFCSWSFFNSNCIFWDMTAFLKRGVPWWWLLKE